jgi:hypothetical protein
MRRVDQQRVGFGDRVGKRHEADAERAELDAAAHVDHVELDLARKPLFSSFPAIKRR